MPELQRREYIKPTPFDVILTTHNHLELTINSINALFQNTTLPFNLVVIDDSTDLTPQWIESFQKEHPNVKYVRPPIIKNGNHSWKLGLEQTTSEFVAMMVNSCCVEPDWEGMPLDLLKQNSKVGMVGIKLLYPHGVIWHAGKVFQNSLPYHIGTGEPAHHYTKIMKVAGLCPAVAFLRREAVKDAFDDKTYIGWRGYEDDDVCCTLRQNGWGLLYCGYSSAYHIESPTRLKSNEDQYKFWQEFNENQRRFLSKWQNKEVLTKL